MTITLPRGFSKSPKRRVTVTGAENRGLLRNFWHQICRWPSHALEDTLVIGRIRLTVQVRNTARASEGSTPSSRRAGHARRRENPQKGVLGGGRVLPSQAGFWSSDPEERVSWGTGVWGQGVSATDMHQGAEGL